MQKLRAHPDLGGDEWNASLINEARDVLLNPERRAAYDVQIGSTGAATYSSSDREHTQNDVSDRPCSEPHRPDNADDNYRSTVSPGSQLTLVPPVTGLASNCPFCHHGVAQKPFDLQQYPTANRCTHCDAPLNSVNTISQDTLNDLRKINRSRLEQRVNVWDKWPRTSAYNASVHDWSTAGCRIKLQNAIEVNSIILLVSSTFDATAIVRNQTDNIFYGLEFLTLEVNMTPGSLFKSSA